MSEKLGEGLDRAEAVWYNGREISDSFMSVKRHGRVVDGESAGVICSLDVLKMLNRGGIQRLMVG